MSKARDLGNVGSNTDALATDEEVAASIAAAPALPLSGGTLTGNLTVQGTVDVSQGFTVGGEPMEVGAVEGIFWQNPSTVSSSYTLPANTNSFTAGPLTVADGVTITIPDGSAWTII